MRRKTFMTLPYFAAQQKRDLAHAEDTRARGCHVCGAKLYPAHYQRVARGLTLFLDGLIQLQCQACDSMVTHDIAEHTEECRCHCGGELRLLDEPVDVPKELKTRYSYVCSKCNARTTPASERFLGRKVYIAAIVVLRSAMDQGVTDDCLSVIDHKIDRRNVRNWRSYWQDIVPKTKCWQAKAAASFVPPLPAPELLPASALERFVARTEEKLEKFLKLIAPLTCGDRLRAAYPSDYDRWAALTLPT
ncbi:MAG: hypothetical protein FWD64_07700 [Acidobacteriaceae bacterium]|nr:hypothetical protein [Acidobacteriaceae bacterium]